MRFGLGVLRLAPEKFWKTTPRELHAAAEGAFGPATRPLARETLDEMLRRYPDARTT